MDIEGLSEERLRLMVESGLIEDVADLYSLTADQIADLPRMGQLSASNILSELEASKEQGLDRLLTALGIAK